MKDYIEFIVFQAFETLLNYEDKRTLTIEQINNYRIELIKQDVEYHSQFDEYEDQDFEKKVKAFQQINMNMSETEAQKRILSIIQGHSDLFTVQGDVITLNKNITADEIEDRKFDLDCYSDSHDRLICSDFIGMQDHIACLNVIGVSKIVKEIEELVRQEKILESAYRNYRELGLYPEFTNLSLAVTKKIAEIGKLPDNKMRCYNRTIAKFRILDDSIVGRDPIICDEIMEQDKFYTIQETYADACLRSDYMRAIFKDSDLAYDNLLRFMDAMWSFRSPDATMEIAPNDEEAFARWFDERQQELENYEDEFEESVADDDDDEYKDEEDYFDQIKEYYRHQKIDFGFYLSYIRNLDEYQNECGNDESLENAKGRLLYLLDTYGKNLHDHNNFQTALLNVSTTVLDRDDDLWDFYLVARLLLVDILKGWAEKDDLLLRKILFIKTYYDITKDRVIAKIFAKYNDTELGKDVRIAIIDHDYSMMRKLTTSYQKKKTIN